MAQYDLDKLGWVEFESLIQTLLKSELGIGVEAWGGSSDEGRDAYFPGKLRYPSKELAPGPFVFQAKFVRGANAAGAKSLPLVKSAVSAEAKRIRERLPTSPPPQHYSLLTNAPLSADARRQLEMLLRPSLPKCQIHFHDGNDICRWLDTAPTIASRFPQLFTISDLVALLVQAGNRGVKTRSDTAVQMAKDSARVFVPTQPYFTARKKLRKFGFCILEGPPEMGKTTIGRMIAMSQMVLKWDAVECKAPKEFHDLFESSTPQIFIADDFFGRTEYDPGRKRVARRTAVHLATFR
jgi:Novel STAND NTPase 3